jgi:hypothetical protein
MGLLFSASLCMAQTVSQTTTTTAAPVEVAGTVSTFDPAGQAIVVTSPAAHVPVTYGYTKQTAIVDELGNPVAVEVVRSGVPVTVHYTQAGDQMVASKIVVRRTTTTTTTSD